jgi:hypothetical protein
LGRSNGCGLCGTVATQPASDKIVAKIIMRATDYATLADTDGHYVLRNLPLAQYHVAFIKPASRQTVANEQGGEVCGDVLRPSVAEMSWLDTSNVRDELLRQDTRERFGLLDQSGDLVAHMPPLTF